MSSDKQGVLWPGNILKHYKGGLYVFVCEAEDTVTKGNVVIYVDEGGKYWSRPSEEFYAFVPLENGGQVSRFEKCYMKGDA